jgi:hypothetical protein
MKLYNSILRRAENYSQSNMSQKRVLVIDERYDRAVNNWKMDKINTPFTDFALPYNFSLLWRALTPNRDNIL